ncbi:MAG: sulfatase-like hydrolase/transferase [Oceanipulchritudo sp.]
MQAQRQPNILFILTDDQRFDTIHALGNPAIQTPNLDRLVARGTAFTNAHIPGGTCGAVCMPSRAMIHTGRTLFHLQDHGAEVPDEHALLGETLRSAGYNCFGTGKWHNGGRAYARSFSDGAEIFFGGMWDHWNVPACQFDPTGRYDQWRPAIRNPWLSRQITQVCADHVHLGTHSTDLFTDASMAFLEKQQTRQDPFFLYLSHMAPHDPRSMPAKYLEMYADTEVSLPDNFLQEHPFDYGISQIRDEKLASQPRTPEEIRQHLREYFAMITHLDDQIGRLFAVLEQQGILKDTIIVLAGDNGLALGQHGLMGKQSVYDHSVRIPLLMAGPGIPENSTRDAFVYLMDIYPTLCDCIGIPIPETVEGMSFKGILDDTAASQRDALYLAYEDRIRAIKDHTFKYIRYRTDSGVVEQLFNLKEDPLEIKNLAANPAFAGVLADYRSRLDSMKEDWEDQPHPLSSAFWNHGLSG